jgi:Pyruvate/2-oxoacid:ferredoxin oxidoreductase delta subunit
LKPLWTADFLKFVLPLAVPLLAGVVAWFCNERTKRAAEEYQRKEPRYQELLRTIRGFYAQVNIDEEKKKFVEQLKLCWLYCPDEVIRKGYAFLNAINSPQATDAEKYAAHGDFVVAIRKDLLSRKITRKTKPASKDYQQL